MLIAQVSPGPKGWGLKTSSTAAGAEPESELEQGLGPEQGLEQKPA